MKNIVALGARLLLGVIFFVFGLNGFWRLYRPVVQLKAAPATTNS